MSTPILFAETPRAAGIGHRFLVPVGCSVSEADLTAFFQSVNDDICIGCNFLAARRAVEQRVNAGAVRQGSEILILAGIDVSRISGRKLVDAVESLGALLDRLADLVTSQIDWSASTGSGLIVTRPELADWLRTTTAFQLPATEWRDGPRRLSPVRPPPEIVDTRRGNMVTMIAVAVIALVVGAVGGAAFVWHLPAARNPEVAHSSQLPIEQSPVPKKVTGKPELPDTPVDRGSPAGSPDAHSVSFGEQLAKATWSGNANDLVKLISELPAASNVSKPNCQLIIDYSSSLLARKRFDDSLRIATKLLKFKVNAEQRAAIQDLQRKAKEANEALEHKDRMLYERIRESPEMTQLESAHAYLTMGPLQSMSIPVTQWLDWAKSAIDIEIVSITGVGPEPCNIRFAANSREVGFKDVFPGKKSPLQLTLNTSYLGVTRQSLPAKITVTVSRDDGVAFFAAASPFVGKLELSRSAVTKPVVDLQSSAIPPQSASLKIQCPSLTDAPELPNWRQINRTDRAP